jgi:hypothetical protein
MEQRGIQIFNNKNKIVCGSYKMVCPGCHCDLHVFSGNRRQQSNTNTYGAGVFIDVYPIQYVFGRVEYQHLWYNQKVKGDPHKYTSDDDFLLMGAGIKVPIGKKASAFASVLFNVLNNDKSSYYMYKNPIYSVGIEVGL